MDMNKTLEDFHVGQSVNVTALPNDLFHNFTGTVKEVNAVYIIVTDQDGDCYDCEPNQLSANTDEIMHD